MNNESTESYRILAKLLELFYNICSNIYDKLIRLLHQNKLIGHVDLFDKILLTN